MANEVRLRANNISGAINDNPLLIGATTINSPGFADLPAVDTTNHLILALDPLEVFGAAEIVMVTAHTASATSVTAVRGQEGSIARQHSLGTTWFHGPVTSDWNYTQRTALSTNRPTSPFDGELIYETDTNRWSARSSSGVWLPAPHNPPMCKAVRSTALAAANGASVLVTYPAADAYDTDAMHDLAVNPGRLTVNTPGVFSVTFNCTIQVVTHIPELADVRISVSGTDIAASTHDHERSDTPLFISCTILHKATVGQFFEARIVQTNSGGVSKDIQAATFSATWVGIG